MVRWIVCALLLVIVTMSFVDRLVLSLLKPDLQARYGSTETGFANLAIVF